MSREPLLSVIVPVYNGGEFLVGAIESIRAQEYPQLEIIVVDDGSTDNTAQVISDLCRRDIRCVTQENRGPAHARNTGLRLARGELISFLDADDLWVPQKLHLQVEHLLALSEAQYVVGRVKFFLNPGSAIPAGFRTELLKTAPVAYIMDTLLARRPIFDLVGDFDVQLTSGEDVDWFARSKDANVRHGICDEILVYKRVHSTNMSLNDPTTNQILLHVLRGSIKRKKAFGSTAPDRWRSQM